MKKKLTIVVPFFNEGANLIHFEKRIDEIVAKLSSVNIEFLFVDDGSHDMSYEIVKNIPYQQKKIIKLSKNYGSHYGIFAAIDNSNCDYLTYMSADYQEPIELYVNLLRCMSENCVDMVFASRLYRKTSLSDKLISRLFYILYRSTTYSDYPVNGADIFLINESVINTVKEINEKNTSVQGLLFSLGYKKSFITYEQSSRLYGRSKWSLKKKIKIVVDTLVAFSLFPLRLITYTGITLSVLALVYVVILIRNYYFSSNVVEGWSTLAAIITFGFGLTFLMLGIISEYLWRMFDQVRPRPRYVITEKIGFNDNEEDI